MDHRTSYGYEKLWSDWSAGDKPNAMREGSAEQNARETNWRWRNWHIQKEQHWIERELEYEEMLNEVRVGKKRE